MDQSYTHSQYSNSALLRISQLCEFMIIRVQIDAGYPGLHHTWMLESIVTREICSYYSCDMDRRVLIDVFHYYDFWARSKRGVFRIYRPGAWEYGLIDVIVKI